MAPLYYTLLLELKLSVCNIFERDNRDIEIVSDGVRNIIHISVYVCTQQSIVKSDIRYRFLLPEKRRIGLKGIRVLNTIDNRPIRFFFFFQSH